MTGKLKIRQIAELTGLSPSTVSRVLAGKANVSLQAKEKVFSHARTMGILRDIPASRLLMNCLLLCAPPAAFSPHEDRYYYEVIQEITAEVARFDIHIRKCALAVNEPDIAVFMQALHQPDVDGIVIIGIDDVMLYRLAAESNKPVVMINAKDSEMRLDCVSADHYSIGYSAANYLFTRGHRPVLLFTDLRRETMMQRLDGFKRACLEHHVVFDEALHLLVNHGSGGEQARENIEKYLRGHKRETMPSAILCGGDQIAQATIDALNEYGFKVPEDISVMSIDFAHDMKTSAAQSFTAVHLPCRELGTEAVYILQSRLMRATGAKFNLLLQGRIHTGQSVADVKWKRKGLYPAAC
ncbi:LacI family DNA-binding transcriptional regulator [Rahnella aceris]|uniref:LacI family DNA-binding transcriptional regulator n=1 Tax=Rahnella sp. (strain Y9602) TaxID=2703885 RepID=UPI001C263E13|nr:LacI family DNA-binding transcriptional regulator [Rahnella aceris]MBU9853558.1 LacI family DNA-binding transcriptional regulator [Rahnella aceris]